VEVRITARHAHLGEKVKAYALEKLGPLSRYYDRTKELEVVFDESNLGWKIEVIAHIARGDRSSRRSSTGSHGGDRPRARQARRLLSREKDAAAHRREGRGQAPVPSQDSARAFRRKVAGRDGEETEPLPPAPGRIVGLEPAERDEVLRAFVDRLVAAGVLENRRGRASGVLKASESARQASTRHRHSAREDVAIKTPMVAADRHGHSLRRERRRRRPQPIPRGVARRDAQRTWPSSVDRVDRALGLLLKVLANVRGGRPALALPRDRRAAVVPMSERRRRGRRDNPQGMPAPGHDSPSCQSTGSPCA
jgi:hypothetical protein